MYQRDAVGLVGKRECEGWQSDHRAPNLNNQIFSLELQMSSPAEMHVPNMPTAYARHIRILITKNTRYVHFSQTSRKSTFRK